jgi:transcriptional regulator with XRE-family HTH domain
MNDQERRDRLGDFLRESREQLNPSSVGLSSNGRRRTPGLRREEVAYLSGISPNYYTKIEQGRIEVTRHILRTICHALRLGESETAFALALVARRTTVNPISRPEQVSPALYHVLKHLGQNPAYVIGRRWDTLAWNPAFAAVFVDLEPLPMLARNVLFQMFTVPIVRTFIIDWERHARNILAEFRANFAQYHHDPSFHELIEFLNQNSSEFRQWWAEEKRVGGTADTQKDINHPVAGCLHLLQTGFVSDDSPNLRLVLYLPLDSETEQKLGRLYRLANNER